MLIRRGLAALARAQELGGSLGPYALQAAIAACHARARTAAQTDWERIAALYDGLGQMSPSPVVELNRAVAVAMAFGAAAGLEIADGLVDEPALAAYHLLPSGPRRPPRAPRPPRGGPRRVRARSRDDAQLPRARPAPRARGGAGRLRLGAGAGRLLPGRGAGGGDQIVAVASANAQSSQGRSASRSDASTVAPHQMRSPGGASR